MSKSRVKKARAMGFKVPAFKKAVKKIINQVVPKPEKKLFTSTGTDASIDIGGVITHLTGIAQGDDVSNRTGNDIMLDYIDMNISLSNTENATAVGAAAFLRVMVVRDTEQDSLDPTVLEVLTTATPSSHLNVDNVGRFQVLYDWKGMINSTAQAPTAGGTGGAPQPYRKFVHFFKKFKMNKAKASYSGANATDVENGQLYFLALTDTDELGTFYYDCRVGYYDS